MSTSPFLIAIAEATTVVPQASEQVLFDLDHTLFVMMGVFLVAVVVLTKWLWTPYLQVREDRVSRVEGYREEATRLEREAAARLARIEIQLTEARREGTAERARARAGAQAKEAAILTNAQAAAQKTLEEARVRLEAAFVAERAKLDDRAKVLAHEISEKVLGRRVVS